MFTKYKNIGEITKHITKDLKIDTKILHGKTFSIHVSLHDKRLIYIIHNAGDTVVVLHDTQIQERLHTTLLHRYRYKNARLKYKLCATKQIQDTVTYTPYFSFSLYLITCDPRLIQHGRRAWLQI